MSKERKHRREENARRQRIRELNAPSARTLAYDVLERVDDTDGYANLLLPQVLRAYKLPTADKSFITDAVYGTLRWRMFLDAVIEAAHKKPAKTINTKLVNVLRLGAYQWLFMNVAEYAAVNETVIVARKRVGKQTTGFVNALMHKIVAYDRRQWEVNVTSRIQKSPHTAAEDVKIQRLAVRYSHPKWIVRELSEAWNAAGYSSNAIHGNDIDIESVSAMLAADNSAPAVTLCVRPSLASVEDVEKELDAIGARYHRGKLSPYTLRVTGVNPETISEVQSGTVGIEDEGSQLAALALANAPIETDKNLESYTTQHTYREQWLDMCAGPGGKTALLAAIAQQRGAQLNANEPHEHRCHLVEDNLRAIDSTTLGEITGLDGREFGTMKPETFDRILVDAPCSGLGALRRRPEARWRKSREDIEELVDIQRGLLDSAINALKSGGVVAYVTCSPALAETREIVDSVLALHADVQRVDVPNVLHGLNTGIPVPQENAHKAPRDMQLFEHIHDTDQMFISILRKK
ncbi:transcription antitermination factor NusB [Alloscardovia venturai]|uniref:Transcription antitermination factor NusB n=1 Tax=Alloscardovia venturai TaxID=1769421 RepID=A0ABW2Y4W5_9BIFI